MKNLTHLFVICLLVLSCAKNHSKVDISGEWKVWIDSVDNLSAEALDWNASTSIILPGTTDGAELGEKCILEPALEKPQLFHLTRKYSHIGAAWYMKEVNVPEEWDESP